MNVCVCGGGGGGWGDASAWFRFLPLVLIKNVTASGRVGCFARRPSFTLTLSDSILSNLTTKNKKKIMIIKNNHEKITIWGVSCSQKDIFVNFPVGQEDTMVYKIMSRRWFWSQVNVMPAFVVLDPQVPCHQQN